jgi:hypothetical protein
VPSGDCRTSVSWSSTASEDLRGRMFRDAALEMRESSSDTICRMEKKKRAAMAELNRVVELLNQALAPLFIRYVVTRGIIESTCLGLCGPLYALIIYRHGSSGLWS